MPGVPSFRGCEACHRQKKKCDQAKPRCSRCTRLDIACVGSGQQRFKFKDESKAISVGNGQQRLRRKPGETRSISNYNTAVWQRPGSKLGAPSWPLSNGITRANGAIVSVLEITDPRYDISAFGPFIKDIPAQLGTHAALDASTEALTSALSCVRSRRITAESLKKYSKALLQVQNSLQDSDAAYSEQNLCAIYFIMLCQGWITNEDHSFTGHGQAMAYLLNAIVSKNLHNSGNAVMLVTMSISVLLESIFNPTIQLRPWLFKLSEVYKPPTPVHSPDGVALTSVELHQLILMRDIIRNPSQHVEQMRSLYHLIQLELPPLQMHIECKVKAACAVPVGTLSVVLLRLHMRYLAAYSLLLSMGLTINGYLRAISHCQDRLAEDLNTLYTQGLSHAEDMKDRRPLGASHIPLLLVSAWVAIGNDPSRRDALGAMIYQYESDLTDLSWLSKAEFAKTAFKRQCRKLERLAARGCFPEAESDSKAEDGIVINEDVEFEPDDACSFL